MKIQCEFIGWCTEGKQLIFNGFDLMNVLNYPVDATDNNKYLGLYPGGIPKPENIGKKLELTPRFIPEIQTKIAFVEFTMCYYLFYLVKQM